MRRRITPDTYPRCQYLQTQPQIPRTVSNAFTRPSLRALPCSGCTRYRYLLSDQGSLYHIPYLTRNFYIHCYPIQYLCLPTEIHTFLCRLLIKRMGGYPYIQLGAGCDGLFESFWRSNTLTKVTLRCPAHIKPQI